MPYSVWVEIDSVNALPFSRAKRSEHQDVVVVGDDDGVVLLPFAWIYARRGLILGGRWLVVGGPKRTFSVAFYDLSAILCTVLKTFFLSISPGTQVSPLGKGVLITGCESPLARALARRLDDLGFTVFAGFKALDESTEAEMLKAMSSGRLKPIPLDVTSEVQVSFDWIDFVSLLHINCSILGNV